MKVLHVIPSLSPIYGGPSFSTRHMVEALAALGVDLHVASTTANGQEDFAIRRPMSTRCLAVRRSRSGKFRVQCQRQETDALLSDLLNGHEMPCGIRAYGEHEVRPPQRHSPWHPQGRPNIDPVRHDDGPKSGSDGFHGPSQRSEIGMRGDD